MNNTEYRNKINERNEQKTEVHALTKVPKLADMLDKNLNLFQNTKT